MEIIDLNFNEGDLNIAQSSLIISQSRASQSRQGDNPESPLRGGGGRVPCGEVQEGGGARRDGGGRCRCTGRAGRAGVPPTPPRSAGAHGQIGRAHV